jgi:hypothetical protein
VSLSTETVCQSGAAVRMGRREVASLTPRSHVDRC